MKGEVKNARIKALIDWNGIFIEALFGFDRDCLLLPLLLTVKSVRPKGREQRWIWQLRISLEKDKNEKVNVMKQKISV